MRKSYLEEEDESIRKKSSFVLSTLVTSNSVFTFDLVLFSYLFWIFSLISIKVMDFWPYFFSVNLKNPVQQL